MLFAFSVFCPVPLQWLSPFPPPLPLMVVLLRSLPSVVSARVSVFSSDGLGVWYCPLSSALSCVLMPLPAGLEIGYTLFPKHRPLHCACCFGSWRPPSESPLHTSPCRWRSMSPFLSHTASAPLSSSAFLCAPPFLLPCVFLCFFLEAISSRSGMMPVSGPCMDRYPPGMGPRS